jgi:DNA-binding NarL/FixJ family response regulator
MLNESKRSNVIRVRFGVLSEREKQIAMLAQSLSNKDIARKLSVTEGTVKAHLHAIYIKLGVKDRSQLSPRLHLPLPAPASKKTAASEDQGPDTAI